MTDKSNVIQFAQRQHSYHENVARPRSPVAQYEDCVDSRFTGHPMVTISSIDEGTAMRGCAYLLPPEWESAVESWLAWLKLGGLRPTTLRLRRGHVRVIARRSGTVHPADLTLAIVTESMDGKTYSNEHRKGLRTSLIGFYDWCCQNGIASANPFTELPQVTGDKPRPRPCPDQMWTDLLVASGPRERMMARLAGEVGMRRAEVAVCAREDLIADVDGWALIVHGKGGKQRVVPLTDRMADAVQDFCSRGYLFPGAIDGHISDHYVGKLISALMPAGWSMHKLRHRYATKGYAGTGNLRAVQEALGHASVATTQRYTAVSSREVRSVSEAAGRNDSSERKRNGDQGIHPEGTMAGCPTGTPSTHHRKTSADDTTNGDQ